jgi:short-subunit dehydrogenase
MGTAVVTGASSGIGQTYAHTLARESCDLILVARRQERLATLADELKVNGGIGVECLPADLSDREQVERVGFHLAALPEVEFLINAAGFGTMGSFTEVPLSRHLDMIQVHVGAIVQLTHAVLPGMIRRRQGCIVNVASLSAYQVGPGQATYNATKAFLTSFSESLQTEVRTYGVRVQALCPGVTYTGFHDTEEFKKFDRSQIPKFFWMTAEDVVQSSRRSLKGHQVICIPSFRNKVLATLFAFGPARMIAGRYVRKKGHHDDVTVEKR